MMLKMLQITKLYLMLPTLINLPNTSYQYFLPAETNSKFVFRLIDIKHIIIDLSLKNNSSFGYNLISNKLVKLSKPVIVRSLTLIINRMLSTGIFPVRGS